MEIVPFKQSAYLSIGMELELQLINSHTFDLATKAKDLMKSVEDSEFKSSIKPEITQSMIEINSSIHTCVQGFYPELSKICHFMSEEVKTFDTQIAGSGTHPFQFWSARKIFPSRRFEKISKVQGYLSKCFTIFGMHLHLGCKEPDDAIYLTHVLTRYVPHFIALSASSPFYQNSVTGFNSTRTTIIGSVPFSGYIPFLTDWEAFSVYFNKMRQLNMIESMKDIYWDIRPKPAFGTVEIRVCDTPLTLNKAITIAAFIQSLAHYLLKERPHKISNELYLVYDYNKYHACHDGYEADFINPYTLQRIPLIEDIKSTLNIIEPYAKDLNNTDYLNEIKEWVEKKENDASILSELYAQKQSFEYVVKQQCEMWVKSIYEQQ